MNVTIQKPYTHMIIIDIYVGFIFDSTFNLKFSQSLIITIYINTINDLYRLHSLKLNGSLYNAKIYSNGKWEE